MKEVKIKVVADTKDANQNIKNVDNSIKDTSASTNQLTGTLDKMSGGAVSGFKAFAGGLKTVAIGFRTVGGAIAASGLGLLVITISALTAAFRGSEEGQNKFSKIMGVIGAVTGNLIDLLADLGEKIISVFENPKQAVIDFTNLLKENIINRFEGMLELIPALGTALGQLFSGEFSAAAETAGNAFGKVALGVEDVTGKVKGAIDASKDFVAQNLEEGKAAAKVADMRAKADKIERKLITDRAETERKISELRVKAKDLNNTTAAERKAALEEAMELTDSLVGQEQEVAVLRRDAQLMENSFARSTKENLDEAARLTANVTNIETRRNNNKRRLQSELSAAEKQEQAEKDARDKDAQDKKDKAAADDKIRLKSISDFKKELIKKDEDNDAKTEEQKLALERTRAEEKLAELIGTEEEKREALLALNEYYNQKEDELEEQRRGEKKAKDEQDVKDEIAGKERVYNTIAQGIKRTQDLTNGAFQLADALGKQDEKSKEKRAKAAFNVNKALSLATATVDATKGVQKAFAETTDFTPTQSLRTANAIIAGVVGAGNIAAIASQKFEGGGGSRGASNIPSSSAAESNQAPAFNLVQGTEGSAIQESIQNKGSEPIKAYVVSGEVQSQASLDRSIEDNSSI